MLPYELIGMILDYFETDKAELAKCTLIARSWVQPGRYHLFRTVTIVQSSDVDGLDGFHRFLESERGRPSATYIQGLGFRGVPLEDDEYWEPTLDLHELGASVSDHEPTLHNARDLKGQCPLARSSPYEQRRVRQGRVLERCRGCLERLLNLPDRSASPQMFSVKFNRHVPVLSIASASSGAIGRAV